MSRFRRNGPFTIMDDLTTTPLFTDAPVAYSIIDPSGRQIAANSRFWDLFGYEPGTPLSVADLTDPDFQDETDEYLDRMRAGADGLVVTEKRYVRADGTQFWGRLTAQRIVDSTGEPILLGIIQDIDEQRALQDELRNSAHMRSEFVSQVSHELRNPLHTIAGMAELLTDAALEAEQHQHAEVILREARSLASIVSDLLDIGRIDAGNFDVEPVPFGLRGLVDRSVRSAQSAAAPKGLRVTALVEDDAPINVVGDPRRVGQILDNLLGNAVKFSSTGSVTLAVSRRPLDTGDTDWLRFLVQDTGPGIPPEFVDRLYEPFHRANESTTGAGLGLAISLRLAESMGGSLTLVSTSAEGTEFALELPLPVTDATTADTKLPTNTTRSGHILVVEDNPETQMLAAAQLKRLGYDHDVVGDGYQALEVSATVAYDAILMDWHLPGMDGLETTRRIRQREVREGRPRVPIISVTARAMASDIEACRQAGADDFVAKPASLTRIGEVLDRWTGAGQSQADEATDTTSELFVGLLEELGDYGIVRSLGETFLAELPARVEAITATDGSDDRAELVAHTLASTSLMFGAVELGEIAREIEEAARASQEITEDHRARLTAVAAATETEMTAVLESLRGEV